MFCFRQGITNKGFILLASVATSSSMSLAHAAEFELGDFTINFDSSFTAGASYRVESRDQNLVGKNNNPELLWVDGPNKYNAVIPSLIRYSNSEVWAQQGSYSANGDLSNLNYDAGDAFSKIISGTHELDINAGDWGFFSRFMYFYDQAANNHKGWQNPLTGKTYDLCKDPEAKARVCQDFRMLDAFLYGNFNFGDTPVSVRLGDQVVSWGESSLISHGINAINPVDIARLKAPGAELKEAFIPVGMLWTSIGLTENVSLDMFYQYDWQKTILPAPGSYFSTNDFAGDGGYQNNIQIGFTQHPDINAEYVSNEINTWVKASLAENAATMQGILAQLATASSAQEQAQLAQGFYQITAPYFTYGTKTSLRAKSSQDVIPKDSGQYGLKLTIYSADLNDSEFGLYYLNYHSRRPVISGTASNFEIPSIAADVGYILANDITPDNIYNLGAFTTGYLEYVEDIKLYGLSFNTSLNETAIAGEIAYRQDEPLQVDDVELIYAGMPNQLANANLRPEFNELSQIKGVASGGTAKGYILSDTVQAQASITQLFGPKLGADSIAVLVEAGVVQILDMPDSDVMRLNGPGTARGGVLPQGELFQKALSNGAETTQFPSESAWGYKALIKLTYNNIFSGVNFNPRIVFSHDVNGTTPDPMYLFVEDRKSAAINLNFDYLNSISFDFGYNVFWDGVGNSNVFEDRDYVTFSIKYSL